MERRGFLQWVVGVAAMLHVFIMPWLKPRGSAETKAIGVIQAKAGGPVFSPKMVEVSFVRSVEYFEPRMVDGILDGPILEVNYGKMLLPEGWVVPELPQVEPHIDGHTL